MPSRKSSETEKSVLPDPAVTADGGGRKSSRATAVVAAAAKTPAAAGTPQGYAAWMMPAPAALADAPAGSSGHLMGIKAGVDTKADPFADWLGTAGPVASWPNN